LDDFLLLLLLGFAFGILSPILLCVL